MNTLFLNEHRCTCGKLLLKGIFIDGTLEIKCKNCKTINKIGHIRSIDNNNQYLLIIDGKGVIRNISDSASRILGFTDSELIGKHFTEINTSIPEEIRNKLMDSGEVLNDDNYFQVDTFHKMKNGKNFPVQVHIKLYRSSNNEKYLLISVKKRNFNPSHKNKFSTESCDFYFEIDRDGMGEYISPTVEKIFGFSPESLVGINYFDTITSENKIKDKELFNNFSAQEAPYRIKDHVIKNSNGKIVHNELYFTPRFNEIGIFIGYRVLGWVKDVIGTLLVLLVGQILV